MVKTWKLLFQQYLPFLERIIFVSFYRNFQFLFILFFFSVNKLWIFILYLLFSSLWFPVFHFLSWKEERMEEQKWKNKRMKEWKVHSQERENTTAKNTFPLPRLLHNLCMVFLRKEKEKLGNFHKTPNYIKIITL